jgi:heterodisulfide reductase subunit A-like polyferredoxin
MEILRLAVSDCIFAGGFNEPTPAPAPEFGAYTHPDILTAMAFETLTAEFSADASSGLSCPSDKRPVRRLAFIQCAGARDRRYLAHCSAVCCMHAAKQASWMKRRQPDLELIVFYTDLRAPGKAQEAYLRSAEKLGVRFFRRRPGLAAPVDGPAGKGIAVRHETDGRVATTLVDMVVLNGGLACCPYPQASSTAAPAWKIPPDRLCGFCSEPSDIAHSVIQAGNAAALTYAGQNRKGNIRTLTTLPAAGEDAS